MALKQLYINGIGSGTYNIFINSDTYLNSPAMDFNEYSIPAVDGNLITYNKRLNNVVRKFDCIIKKNPVANLEAFKKLIYNNTGYMKIQSDYDTDTYQYGYLAQEIEVDPFRTGTPLQVQFTLYFSCKPQKWFNVNSTQTLTKQWDLGDIFDITTRDSNEVKRIIDALPIDDQPTAEYYAIITTNAENSMGTATNISATNSNGFIVVYYANSYNSTYTTEVICYGNGTASASSFTPPTQTGDQYIRALIPIEGVALTTSLTATTDNGTSTKSVDTTSFTDSISNSDAFGVTMEYEFGTSFPNNNAVLSVPIVISSKLNNVKQNESLIRIHFEDMDADMIQLIKDDYSTGSPDYDITVQVDSDNNALIVNGSDYLDITSYLEVIGDLNGRADSLTYTLYKFRSNPGCIDSVTLKPTWWKL